MKNPGPQIIRILLIGICYAAVVANAQISPQQAAVGGSSDTTTKPQVKHSDPKTMHVNEWLLGMDTFYKWDSTFGFVQRYNRATQAAIPYTDLGINATPQKILLIDPFSNAGFQSGLNAFPLQNREPDKMQFYKAAVPFTKFSYVQGGNGFFILDGVHSQNISPTWNLTVDFTSAQNGEIYTASKQNNLHRGIMLGSNFTNHKGNYQNILITTWNRSRRVENYGLLDGTDTLFFVPDGKYSTKTPSYYPATGTASSFYATHHHVFMQKLFLDEGHKLYLFHRSDWKKEKYLYKETDATPDTNRYGSTYNFLKGAFTDSTVWIQWNNAIGIGNAIDRNSTFPLLWKAFYSADRIIYNSVYKGSANYYYNQGVHANVNFNPYFIYKFNLTGNADYYFAGYNAGDYRIKGDVAWNSHGFQIAAGAQSQAYAAPFYTQMFTSNYRQYISDFKKVMVNAIHGAITFENKLLKLYGNFHSGLVNNFIYTDANCNFKQTNGLRFVTLQGGLNIHAGHFYMDHKFTFQTQNKTDLIPVPKFSDYMSVYYQGFLFKKAMYARMGFDIWMMGKYNGYNYNPELAAFYPSQKNAGNYPIADVFFSGEIKNVQLFVKMEHVNQRATNYGFNNQYYAAIGYPIEPLRLRLGLTWKFYN